MCLLRHSLTFFPVKQTKGRKRYTKKLTMSWQEFVDGQLMVELSGGNYLSSAAIMGQDGNIWAQSPNFPPVLSLSLSHCIEITQAPCFGISQNFFIHCKSPSHHKYTQLKPSFNTCIDRSMSSIYFLKQYIHLSLKLSSKHINRCHKTKHTIVGFHQ